IHLSVGIPDALEPAECIHELRAEHLREKLRPRLTVAVFARQRAAVRNDERGGVLDERLVFLDAGGGLEIEIDPRVNASLSEMAVQRASIAVLLEQLTQVAK